MQKEKARPASKPEASASTSRLLQPRPPNILSQGKNIAGKFIKPQLSRSSSSSANGSHCGSHNTSSHSNNSSLHSSSTTHSSHSSYPESISGYSSTTSSVSIKSGKLFQALKIGKEILVELWGHWWKNAFLSYNIKILCDSYLKKRNYITIFVSNFCLGLILLYLSYYLYF